MDKYEYMDITFSPWQLRPERIKRFNELGEEGWELCAVMGDRNDAIYYLKRKIQ